MPGNRRAHHRSGQCCLAQAKGAGHVSKSSSTSVGFFSWWPEETHPEIHGRSPAIWMGELTLWEKFCPCFSPKCWMVNPCPKIPMLESPCWMVPPMVPDENRGGSKRNSSQSTGFWSQRTENKWGSSWIQNWGLRIHWQELEFQQNGTYPREDMIVSDICLTSLTLLILIARLLSYWQSPLAIVWYAYVQ